ncbi:MucBP domain-containing protein [Lactobacillus sp. R2/2]|nr:MucBP domain-containing protein [Lactobacillus sp. R2/2]
MIVHYQDIEGQKVAPDEILSGFVNDQQVVHTLKLPGYTIQSKNLNGLSTKSELNTTAITLKEKPQKLTYIYTKDIIGNKK